MLYYLAGLTCTEDTGRVSLRSLCDTLRVDIRDRAWKGGFLRDAAEHSIAIVFPDTSPRGAGLEGEDDDWDFGTGACNNFPGSTRLTMGLRCMQVLGFTSTPPRINSPSTTICTTISSKSSQRLSESLASPWCVRSIGDHIEGTEFLPSDRILHEALSSGILWVATVLFRSTLRTRISSSRHPRFPLSSIRVMPSASGARRRSPDTLSAGRKKEKRMMLRS